MALGVSEKKKMARCNPIIYKLEGYTKHIGYMENGSRVAAKAADKYRDWDGEICTYAGINGKALYFLGITVLGYMLFFILHSIFMLSPNRFGALPKLVLESSIHQIDITIAELILFLVAAVFTAILPFIAAFFRKSIPVVGTMYTACQGYFIGFLTGLLKEKYRFIPMLALIITLAIVVVMLYIYCSGKVKVTNRFKSIMYTFFGTAVICSIITGILYFLPFTKAMVTSYFTFLNSPIVSLAISIVFFIAATLFLLVDFETIRSCVEDELPIQYEWMAAWGLSYTVIYIYMRIFGYLLRIFSMLNKKK